MSKIKDIPDRKRTSSDIPSFVALSFFSGAMGLDIGLHNVGLKPCWLVRLIRRAGIPSH